jgi:hypothetical protein
MLISFLLLRNKTKKGQEPPDLPTSAISPKRIWVEKFLLIDWIGGLLSIGAGIFILLALNWGSNEVWRSGKVIASFTIGGFLFIALGIWEWWIDHHRTFVHPDAFRTRALSRRLSRLLLVEPLLPLDVLYSRDVNIVLYASFVSGMIMLVMFYFVSIFMVVVEQLDPQDAGVQLVYFAPGMGAGVAIVIVLVRFLRQVCGNSILNTHSLIISRI